MTKKTTTAGRKAKLKAPRQEVVRMLDVHDQFATHAEALVKAAKVGAQIHVSGNIAESGGPLETAFRNLFGYALPSTFLTTAGYFFGHEFELSGQVDFLLCDETDVLKLPPQEGMVTGYVPYRSVKVMGQLKNSSRNLKEALDQTASALAIWKRMADRHPSTSRKEPLALVVIGKGGTDRQVRKTLASFQGRFPAYILLVEKGLLYGPRKNSLVFDDDAAFYTNQGNGGPLVLLEAATPPKNDSGRMLMWLFFAVLSHVVELQDNTTLKRIVERAQNLNPVNYSSTTGDIFQNSP
ncbi:DUF6602 domain-containing protein [Burkholderia contaminans]|uniref:DUF6602 domain-containing protein n=1 Tax=Burkholderia contaminans TaxID=488447 RepID=UPI002D7E3D6F|nr:DUF6602 domain-containing protein [Burkholderia contaminans]